MTRQKSNKSATVQKIIKRAIGSWLLGESVGFKVRGNKEEISALTEALAATKKFQETLNDPNAQMQDVVLRLGEMHISTKRFEKVMGFPWPL